LRISKLTVYNFRNLADQSVELREGAVYISGLNGNGKTNLVEALYLLSGSRSFRTNSQTELVRWGAKDASVFGKVISKHGEDELGIALSPGQRIAYRNGDKLQSVSELVGGCCVVAFSPSDLALVKGSPAGRRKFLDRHMVDLNPGFLNTLMAYQRALTSKAALLKEANVTRDQLKAWNELLVEYGGKVVDNRRIFIESLVKKAETEHQKFAQNDGQLELALESDFIQQGSSEFSAAWATEQLDRIAPREIAQRTTLFGPHRDDMAIRLSGVDSRAYASQGQTRSLVLALKLGVIALLEQHSGESPIVVLDDVDSELDAPRAQKLFKTVASGGRQVIITGTSTPPPELLEGGAKQVQLIRIQEGRVISSEIDMLS
jgi:DNA replication and repair protein RecF